MKNIIICMALAMTLAACADRSKESKNEEPAAEATAQAVTLTDRQMQAVGITLGTMERRILGNTVRASGQLALDARSRADVSPLCGGVVRAVLVGEGDAVKAGQTVAYIENTEIVELQKSYLVASGEAASAQLELQRQQRLAAQDAGVKKSLQQAETALAAASAQKKAVERQLRQLGVDPGNVAAGRFATRMPVASPISGVVGRVRVSLGSYVDMQTVMMTVADNSRLHCDLTVFEKDVPSLREGQWADIVLTNDRSVHLRGRIYGINSSFDDDTRAIRVHCSLEGKAGARLMPGMYVNAMISTGTRETDAMPDEAIVGMGGKKYIFAQTSAANGMHTFRAVEVATGATGLGFTAVTPLSALPSGACLVKANAFYISSMLEGGGEEE